MPSIDHLVLADRLAVLLDLDGTLIPFAPTVEAAVLDARVVEILGALHEARVQVMIVSGRPRLHVASLCELAPWAWWVAEHGCWRYEDGGAWSGPSEAPEVDELLQLFDPFTRTPGVRVEPKSVSACLHWRLVPEALKEPLVAAAELACDEWLEAHPGFERLGGVEMLEVRRRAANKSLAVAWARQRLPDAKLIAIGDDETDEDMFAALHGDELAIGVGPRRTQTPYRLSGPTAVHAFLRWIVDTRSGHTLATRPSPLTRIDERPPEARKLVVVANRTPTRIAGKARPVGGLVSALEPALAESDGIWLGWSGHEALGERRLRVDVESQPALATFDFSPAWREQFYGGFCNRALWPLFHSFPGRVRYSDEDWLAYVQANAEFARHAVDLVAKDGIAWVHDYQLLLVGRGMRQRGFDGALGLFLHIPFPQADLFTTLPWAAQLVEALLEYDLVGFHTAQWADNFRACMGTRSRRALPEIAVLPIGIDPTAFAPGGVPSRDVAGLRTALGARRLILGVDRLDYSKGIPERLLAFERLLELRPEWRNQVSFVQISVPSREDVPEYAELRERVENLVGRINGRFGEADWVPVRYLYRSYDHGVLAELYRLADVGLVTPLRDGLNLVAKEFVAAQDASRPGVLVLSQFAGAATELTSALLTNPYHPDGLACDLDRALRMELSERRDRHARLRAVIERSTPATWATAFLQRLAATRRPQIGRRAGKAKRPTLERARERA